MLSPHILLYICSYYDSILHPSDSQIKMTDKQDKSNSSHQVAYIHCQNLSVHLVILLLLPIFVPFLWYKKFSIATEHMGVV